MMRKFRNLVQFSTPALPEVYDSASEEIGPVVGGGSTPGASAGPLPRG